LLSFRVSPGPFFFHGFPFSRGRLHFVLRPILRFTVLVPLRRWTWEVAFRGVVPSSSPFQVDSGNVLFYQVLGPMGTVTGTLFFFFSAVMAACSFYSFFFLKLCRLGRWLTYPLPTSSFDILPAIPPLTNSFSPVLEASCATLDVFAVPLQDFPKFLPVPQFPFWHCRWRSVIVELVVGDSFFSPPC